MNQITKIDKTAEISKYLPGGSIYQKHSNKETLSAINNYIVESLIVSFTSDKILDLEKLVNKTTQNIQSHLKDENNTGILSKLEIQSSNYPIKENLSEIYRRMENPFKILANEGLDLFDVSKEEFCYEKQKN